MAWSELWLFEPLPWLVASWSIYLVILAGWIVLQKREPIATLSWIMSLALLPVLGLLIYHFFGPQQIHRNRLRRAHSRAGLDACLPSDLRRNPDAVALAKLAQASSGYAPTTAANATLLVGGAQTYDALLAAIAQAQHHVHVEYYIFEPDGIGTRLRDALIERARAGVRVRVLLDAIGSSGLSRGFLAPLTEAGAELAWFHPKRLRWIWRPRLNLRNHRKLVVIDGTLAYTGGINITDTEDERLCPAAFHDLHLQLQGEVVRWLQLAFLEDWHYATRIALRDDRLWPALERGDLAAQVLPAGPDSPWEVIHRIYVEAIHLASKRVWLITPYFVPGEAARMALSSAALRGVDVRIMVPKRSDSRVASAAARSYYDELLAAGIRVFEYERCMLHSKALLVDDETCVIGSANFDHRSFRLNFELSVLLVGRDFAGTLDRQLTLDFASCAEVKADRPRPPFAQRLGDACARLFSPIL